RGDRAREVYAGNLDAERRIEIPDGQRHRLLPDNMRILSRHRAERQTLALLVQNEIPLALIGASHFLISAARKPARYSGVRRSGAPASPPTCLSRCCTAGASSAATVARLSLCTISGGVWAGRKSAYQLGTSKSVSPCSCAEARSGRLEERCLLRIAI